LCVEMFAGVLAVQHMMYGFGDDPNVSLLNYKDMMGTIMQLL
jgi:hypothetical protein